MKRPPSICLATFIFASEHKVMTFKVGRITLSDRASQGVYKDQSGPEIERIVQNAFEEEIVFLKKLLPDDRKKIETALLELTDREQCQLIITTGGTGPSSRDVTPEATRAILDKELPGFGELMRMESYRIVKTSILSRATAGIRGQSLIVNLPGNPKAIGECLPLILPAVVEAISHLTDFRPKLRD